jgi:hypothetical protein
MRPFICKSIQELSKIQIEIHTNPFAVRSCEGENAAAINKQEREREQKLDTNSSY